ncbi:MAG: carboxypeptidase-like regulatory domain-containing protein [Thermoanaerobaculia bacterium]|nr:carboxypeptidase-like regulatory domain-containing protein [Thermoanaerobaculia bacterium]
MRVSIAVVAAILAVPAFAGFDPDAPAGLSGVVKHGPGPIGQAGVYAYRVTDLDLTRVTTDEDGTFLFRTLPAGVYKIIAHKAGYVPAVVLFTRATQLAADFLEFELTPETRAELDGAEDFWSIRRKIPGDVLREIRLAEAAAVPAGTTLPAPRFELETELSAGTERFSTVASSQRRSGHLGVESRLGEAQLSVRGRFDSLEPSTSGATTITGYTRSIAVGFQDGGDGARSAVQLSALQHSFDSPYLRSDDQEVELGSYQVGWVRDEASGAQSGASVRFMDEQGLHIQAGAHPLGVPEASRTFAASTYHRREIDENHTVKTGLNYRETTTDNLFGRPFQTGLTGLGHQWINVYGVATSRLESGLILEYGLYSNLLDGVTSWSPHTGLIMEFGDRWRAETSVRKRIGDEEPTLPGFSLAHYSDLSAETGAEDHMYRIGITRSLGDAEHVSIEATHREVGDTVRVFFNEDFFQQVESIYLVRGDTIPELQVEVTQKLAPGVFARLESNVAQGGGGVFRAAEEGQYSNQFRYLVTSMDTEFQRTATGVLLAFHRIEQSLEPLTRQFAVGLRAPAMSRHIGDTELDTLQLTVTQELPFLMDLGTQLAVLLNLELSRGTTPYGDAALVDEDELRRRVAGGIALRF